MATATIRATKVSRNTSGRFGAYGGRYVPETLMSALEELEREYEKAKRDRKFRRRQELNVVGMRLVGAEVRGVDSGSRTLKDAINEAMRDWVTNVRTTHYLLGSVLGAHPYPTMVRDFHKVIGRETRRQILRAEGKLPNAIIACVGGGSNSIGIFHDFLKDKKVRLIGVEAGGRGDRLGEHAARFCGGSPGVLQGTYSYVLQDDAGQISTTHSISAGLAYPSIGPDNALLTDTSRPEYVPASDAEALEATTLLARTEGI